MDQSAIIAIASRAYSEGTVQAHFDEPGRWKCDILGKYIVEDLQDAYDPEESDQVQLWEAVRAMRRARDVLNRLITALEDETELLQGMPFS